jgi:SAM-dependent methyltransferase
MDTKYEFFNFFPSTLLLYKLCEIFYFFVVKSPHRHFYYFQFYGYLSQQQNMMQDYIRTSTYQRAILANLPDFKDKVVLDVGAGSGILSFFAIQAGARKVYAVEASTMAQHAEVSLHLIYVHM